MVNNKSLILAIGLLGLIIISGAYFTFLDSNNLNTSASENYELKQVFPELEFSSIVGIQATRSYPNNLFIVEQSGRIQLVKNFDTSSPNKSTFLDIQNRVLSGGEMGLLGLTFDPDFSENGYFYVNYNMDSPRRTVISRYSSIMEEDVLIANSSSELIILEVQQPYSNHNAGDLAFGSDDYLYIPLGDGGSGGDPLKHGQNISTLLGSILRIDVSQSNNSHPYRIPSDNPFFNNINGYREEIFAYGLRNPWRISFDSETGELWTGDVGQSTKEEVNIIKKGKNYGWNIMEGDVCYNSATCNMNGLELPIWSYPRSQGTTVTGGYVYRGTDLSSLKGKYIFGDYGSGKIWTLLNSNNGSPEVTELFDVSFGITTFGVDSNQELYVADYKGKVYKFNHIESSISSTITQDISSSKSNDNASTSSNATSVHSFTLFSIVTCCVIGISARFMRKKLRDT